MNYDCKELNGPVLDAHTMACMIDMMYPNTLHSLNSFLNSSFG